jgi:hypothetical protein
MSLSTPSLGYGPNSNQFCAVFIHLPAAEKINSENVTTIKKDWEKTT